MAAGISSRKEHAPVSPFVVLGPLGKNMQVGFVDDGGLQDLQMVDYSVGSLKRGRSPPKAKSALVISSSALEVSSQAASASIQVTPPIPSFSGVRGGRGFLFGVLPINNEGSLFSASEFSSSPEVITIEGVSAETYGEVLKAGSVVGEDGVGSLRRGYVLPTSKGDSLCLSQSPRLM